MRITRCYISHTLQINTEIILPDSIATRLARVMRLQTGDNCILFNGDGQDYTAKLTISGKSQVSAYIHSTTANLSESPLHLTLLQSIARGEKMDFILQKATELGVSAIVPLITERTEVKLDAQRTEKRLAHWQSIIASACEQSGRATLPTLSSPLALDKAITSLPTTALKLTLSPVGENRLSQLPYNSNSELIIAIGPEGGLSPKDQQILQTAGFIGLRLGPRILRTETAGLAAITVLQSHFGDM